MCLENGVENVAGDRRGPDFGMLVATESVARSDAAGLLGSDVSR